MEHRELFTGLYAADPKKTGFEHVIVHVIADDFEDAARTAEAYRRERPDQLKILVRLEHHPAAQVVYARLPDREPSRLVS